jgi:hypothetical protein
VPSLPRGSLEYPLRMHLLSAPHSAVCRHSTSSVAMQCCNTHASPLAQCSSRSQGMHLLARHARANPQPALELQGGVIFKLINIPCHSSAGRGAYRGGPKGSGFAAFNVAVGLACGSSACAGPGTRSGVPAVLDSRFATSGRASEARGIGAGWLCQHGREPAHLAVRRL